MKNEIAPAMLTGDREKNELLEANFPLYHLGEHDFFFSRFPSVGLDASFSSSLKRKIAAALISDWLGTKSVDGVIKSHLQNTDYPEVIEGRLDRRVRRHFGHCLDIFGEFLAGISSQEIKANSEFLGEWTLYRFRFSIDLAAHNAQMGGLFETVAISRMLLEQLSWSYAVRYLDIDQAIRRQAQNTISTLKNVCPHAGRFYGWLSDHAHWSLEGHSKSMVSRGDRVGHLHASCYFKALAMAVLLCLIHCCMKVAIHLVSEKSVFPGGSWSQRAADAQILTSEYLRQICKLDADDQAFNELADILSVGF